MAFFERIRVVLTLLVLLFSSVVNADFTLVATHPYALNQSTSDGKIIKALKAYNGKIYAGYGDWGLDTGPIEICALDPTSETFSCEYNLNGEAITLFNTLDGDLFVPSIDPRGSIIGDAYASKINGVWSDKRVDEMSGSLAEHSVHNQDFGFYQGDLYLVGDYWDPVGGSDGQGRQYPVLWKSTNKGISWTQFLPLPNDGGSTDSGLPVTTFCFAATLDGNLYVQVARLSCRRDQTYSRVYDGNTNTWTTGPTFLPTVSATKKVRNFKDKLVMIHGNKLYAFDGLVTTLASDSIIYDFSISGDELYVLRTSGQICRTKDMLSYNCFDVAPSDFASAAVSIEVLEGFVYVGTKLSQIHKAPIPDRVNGFFPTLYYLLFD